MTGFGISSKERTREMKGHYLGHVVGYVKDLEPSLTFYRNPIGLQEVGRIFNGKVVAYCQLGEHQFPAIFEVKKLNPDLTKHCGLIVRDEAQINEVRDKPYKKIRTHVSAGFSLRFSRPVWESPSGWGFAKKMNRWFWQEWCLQRDRHLCIFTLKKFNLDA
jgi:hypothetical protein